MKLVFQLALNVPLVFSGVEDTITRLRDCFSKGDVPLYFPDKTDERFKAIILECCTINPGDRPTVDELLGKLSNLKELYKHPEGKVLVSSVRVVCVEHVF